MLKVGVVVCILFCGISSAVYAQMGGGERTEEWNRRKLPRKSRGVPEISPWHTGTAGIVGSGGVEVSLFNASRISIGPETELQFRVAEEWLLPNIGLKHRWWGNDRFVLSTEHTLYYTWPLLRILQSTGFKDLVPDSATLSQGLAMRHELLFSWLMNPREFGCPAVKPEMILTLRVGSELYAGMGDSDVKPFDWLHTLYHSQVLDKKHLYYGGLQFDSYFSSRIHYGVNALYYTVDFTKAYALEGNLRFTYYISRKVGISASCKVAYADIKPYDAKPAFVPLVDVTYRIASERREIQHGLFKKVSKRRRR